MLFAVKQRIVNNLLHALDEGVLDEIHRLDTLEKRDRHANIFVRVEDRLNRHYNGIDPLPPHKEHQLLGVRRNIIQDFSGPPGHGFKVRRRKRKKDTAKQAEADYHAFSSAYEIPRGGDGAPRGGQPSSQNWGDAEAARRREASEKVESGARARRAQEQEERQKRIRAHVGRLIANKRRLDAIPGYRKWEGKIRAGKGYAHVTQGQPSTRTPTKPLTTQQQTDRREARKKLSEERLRRLHACLLYTSPSPRDRQKSRMPSSA